MSYKNKILELAPSDTFLKRRKRGKTHTSYAIFTSICLELITIKGNIQVLYKKY